MHARNVLNELGECSLTDAISAVQMVIPLHITRRYGSKASAAKYAIWRCAAIVDDDIVRPLKRRKTWCEAAGKYKPWSARLVETMADGVPRSLDELAQSLEGCKRDTIYAYLGRFVRSGFVKRDEQGGYVRNSAWTGPAPDVHRSAPTDSGQGGAERLKR